MSWFPDSIIDRPPLANERGLIVRPIFSGSDPGVLTVQLASGSLLNIGEMSGSFSIEAPTSASLATVSRTSSTVTLAPANSARKGLTITNDSNAQMYVRLGPGATIAAYTVRLVANAYFELPFPAYTGLVTATWASAGSGVALITELS